jgi:hypothetical protein
MRNHFPERFWLMEAFPVAVCLRLSLILSLTMLFSALAVHAQAQPGAVSGTTNLVTAIAPAMDALLLARRSVESFFEQSSNVVCTETVSQLVLGKNGKPDYREDSRFVYQLQASTNSGSLKLNESRETRKAAFRDAARTLLITNGFTSMLLIVHPNYESSYIFERVGEESVDGKSLVKISFKPVPGGSSPAAFQLRGQNFPLPLSGTLWIDPQNGAITKLIAAVDSSLSDLGLQGMRSEIHYATVQFHNPEESYWMPVSATIDVETPRQLWRNVHRFTAYKRFTATIHIEDIGEKP